jgi:SPP1 family predicted phage head-tail adaptor
MRFRVEIENPTYTDAGSGNRTVAWTSAGSIWADIEPLSSQERFFAAQQQAQSTHRITCRYTDSITQESRLLHGSKTFHVVSLMNTENRNRKLEITVLEEVGK